MEIAKSQLTKSGAVSTTLSYAFKFTSRSLNDNMNHTGEVLKLSNTTSTYWCYLYGFDFSVIPDDAIITKIEVKGFGSSTSSTASYAPSTMCKIMFIRDFAKSGTASSHTAVSDEKTMFSGKINQYDYKQQTVTFDGSSSLVQWANKNIAKMKTEDFGLRIYGTYMQMYGLWIEVTYSQSSVFVGDKNVTVYVGSTPVNVYVGSTRVL